MNDKQNTYYIGQLAKELGLSQRTIRYYEEMELIRPSRTDGGFRTYSHRDAELLRMVMRFKDLGMRLDEIRALLLPSENMMTSNKMAELHEALKLRRNEFQSKIKEYEESILQINKILQVLSNCTNCGHPSMRGMCEKCLKARKQEGEPLSLIRTSHVPDDKQLD